MPVLKVRNVTGFLKSAKIKAEALTIPEHGDGRWRSPESIKPQTSVVSLRNPSVHRLNVAKPKTRTP
jgi:hypothetical protein